MLIVCLYGFKCMAHTGLFCAGRIFLLLLQKITPMTFDIVIIGYVAGFCTAVAQFPQALKVIKTGDTESISIGMYIIMTLGIFFWFLYGVLLSNLPMMLANGVCLLPSVYILYITIRNIFKTKKIST
jgi:MtN3 and saliva related transmembrane protein